MPTTDGYSHGFYSTETQWAQSTAEAIVPFLVDALSPRSVVDVGCGLGAWLARFVELGVDDIVGVDGDWVDTSRLLIPTDRFRRHDLTEAIELGRRFDLVLSLEVAEHLPHHAAQTFVDSLCRLGSVVIFSAAIPGQGGRHHMNEQWPEYWTARFDAAGYRALDCIRPRFWRDSRVASFYAQNTLLFVGKVEPGRESTIQSIIEDTSHRFATPRSLVHPGVWDSMRLQPLSEEHSATELGLAFVDRVRKALAMRARRHGRRAG